MKLFAAVFSLSLLFAATVPTFAAAPHSRVKAVKRRPYKVKHPRAHKATVHKNGH